MVKIQFLVVTFIFSITMSLSVVAENQTLNVASKPDNISPIIDKGTASDA